jgi:predicted ATPase/DNA-binding SARP family transcriptional activator
VIERRAEWTNAAARVAVLGPVSVRSDDGGLTEPAGHRAKGLLVALALAAPAAVGAERLTDEVWGDDRPRGARAALQTLVSRIRSTLGDELIESTPSGYRLADPSAVDLRVAEALLDDARVALGDDRWHDALSAAASGVALWRGEPGADLDAEALAEALRERSARALDGLDSVLASASLGLDLATDAEEIARRLCRRAPFDDSAHLILLRALDALGRSTEAVAVYAGFRERVQDAFGISPALELQALHLELLERAEQSSTAGTGTPAGASGSGPIGTPVRSSTSSAGTEAGAEPDSGRERAHPFPTERAPAFPAERSPATGSRTGTPAAGGPATGRTAVARGIRAAPNALIGRDDALEEIEHLLATARVTTVLGPGGLGKTRVAHAVAGRALHSYGSVVVVELASVRNPGDVVFALASALGIREVATSKRLGDRLVRDDLRGRILARLAEAPTLLVLDNCEHIIDAAAEWSADLTAELPDLTILTTSRTPLAISSERVFALAPLGGPADGPSAPEDDAAVRLFIDRATAARPDAALPPEAVARLCRRLDGLPLAIELAAARIRSMSIDEIERRLSNRFALLSGGDRAAPERHRTLLAVIEWSWNLLGTAEQNALARLSEFADGFSADAAHSVVGCTPDEGQDLLDGLVAQSLVMMRETPGGVRYRMLETVREFGQLQLERTGSRDDVRDAFFAWADGFVRELQPRSDGPEQVATFARIAVEEDNLIDVLRRAIDAERPEIVASVFALLGYYWTLRSAHSEVIAFSKPVFESVRFYEPRDDRALQLVAVLVMITMTTVLSDLRFAVRPMSRLRKLVATHPVGDRRLEAMTALVLNAGSEQRVARQIEATIASDDRATALLGALVGSIAAENEGRRDAAVELARSAARLAEALEDTWGGAMAGQMLAALHSQSAEPDEALRWARRARTGLSALGAVEDIRQLEWVIATNDIAVGALDEAEELFEGLIQSHGQADGIDIASIGLAGKAEVLRARGRVHEARELTARALATFDAPRTRSSPWFLMVLSTLATTLVIDGTGTAEEARVVARRLRARTLASLRAAPGFVDRPVLGASVIGLAVWVEETATIPPRVGLELLALAEAMGSRQDPPALHLRPLFERFRRSFAGSEIDAARADAVALPNAERPERVAALLRTPGPWSWAWSGKP